MNKPDWKPRYQTKGTVNGAIYCSPACGHGCTAREHEIAVNSAYALARALGAGWTGYVWENIGWYYAVRHPDLGEVHRQGHKRYWADLRVGEKQHCAYGTTPRAALAAARRALRAESNDIKRTLRALDLTLEDARLHERKAQRKAQR